MSLTIIIPIADEHINICKHTIIKDSVEEVKFVNEIIALFSKVDASSISNVYNLDEVVLSWADIVSHSWSRHLKPINITKHSKSWWNNKYSQDLASYRSSKSIKSWKTFQKTVKHSKREFFDLKIQEITNKRCGPWELMNWVNKKKLPAIEMIKHNGSSCLELNDLWQALHLSFNSAQFQNVDKSVLNECKSILSMTWLKFSEEEFTHAIINCNDLSASGPDRVFWSHLKHIIKNKSCLRNIICIANACFDLSHWPNHFKKSTTIIIPKPNKSTYDSLKSFRPIILLNTLGKLIEKVIGERLQFQTISNNFIHQSQLGGLKFKTISDAGIALTHFICTGWIKHLSTSILAFDITQFFPSLNHYFMFLILDKAGFGPQVVNFFSNYLVNRKTFYFWNNFSSQSFNINVGVDQGSALSLILSALYLSSFFHIFEKCIKNLDLKISTLSFVDDGLLITQSKSFHLSNTCLFSSYNVVLILLSKFGLQVEYSKTEVFHFSRSYSSFSPPPLDLFSIGGPLLIPKDTWKYLGFIFDRKLCFHKHINYYANKAISTVKCMKILGNSTRGLNSQQKCLLYRSCTLPIVLYGFQLWYYSRAPLSYPLNSLSKLQRRAATWILGAFKTSPSYNIEAIVGLILICHHLQKLSSRLQLRGHTLPANHIIKSLLDNNPNCSFPSHDLSLGLLSKRQQCLLKGHIVNMDNKFNEVFSAFDLINPELQSGNRVIDTFSNCFSFHTFSRKNDPSFKSRLQQLDALAIESSTSSSTALVITDVSVKNNVASSIAHIHVCNKPVVKVLHNAINITSSEAKFFALKCGINHATLSHEISKIIIVIDSIHVTRKIFDPSSHMLQKQSTCVLAKLREFFDHRDTNSICYELRSLGLDERTTLVYE